MPTKIAVVTVARSDYSILKPILTEIERRNDSELQLIVSGMHLAPEFGHTIDEIRADGWPIESTVEHIVSSDSAVGVAKSIGLGVVGFADLFARLRPDFLLLVGDRAEMVAAGLAAQPFELRIAHVHGGETTEGAIDEVFRHCITKMSCLHFASTKQYVDRIIQLGEQPNKVFHSGAPALDNLRKIEFMSVENLKAKFDIDCEKRPILVTYHPETYGVHSNQKNIMGLLDALSGLKNQIIFTSSNADASGRKINKILEQRVGENFEWLKIDNLTVHGYYSVLNVACAMVGNSSSGLIESASFGLPVVNVGDRQRGRVSGENVIHVKNDACSVRAGIEKALSPEFKNSIKKIENPYYNGGASKLIVDTLVSNDIATLNARKRFFDINYSRS